MSSEIIRLGAGDFDEAIAFLNDVFAEHAPHDFAGLLPAVYQPTDEHMRCNYAVRDGGRLGAIVGVFPIDWRVGGIGLKMAGVGGVSVHKDFRGKGYMKLLMNHAVDEMRREGVDLSYLGGRRQRYAYFGYEVGGCKYKLDFIRHNVEHALNGLDTPVVFEPMPTDPDSLATVKALQEAQPNYCRRPVDAFDRYLRSWHYRPMVARDDSGRIVGYVACDKEQNQINELVAADGSTACRMIAAWMQRIETSLTLRTGGPIDHTWRRLLSFAELSAVGASGNWQVFNWPIVIDALMRAKHVNEPMAEGAVTVQVEGQEAALRMVVDASGARCESHDGRADVTVDPLAAIPLLFGPLPPAAVMPLPKSARMLSAWCPLPLGISPQDKV